jgi:ribosomal protein L6P/L9E
VSVRDSITAVTTGFTKYLLFNAVGYSFSVSDNILTLNMGSSASVQVSIPKDIELRLVNNTTIKAFSTSKSNLTNYLNKVRLIKPASKDHYKGKGIIIKNVNNT